MIYWTLTLDSNTNTVPALRSLPSDNVFWFAIVAGPIAWAALYSLNPPSLNIQKDLQITSGLWWQLLLFAGFYPLLEEWLFRGLLQPQLLRYRLAQTQFIGLSTANLLVTFFFVGAHFFVQPPVWALLVIFPSLIFGWFRDKYQSVVPAIVLHSFYNFGYFVFL